MEGWGTGGDTVGTREGQGRTQWGHGTTDPIPRPLTMVAIAPVRAAPHMPEPPSTAASHWPSAGGPMGTRGAAGKGRKCCALTQDGGGVGVTPRSSRPSRRPRLPGCDAR